jgi:predicted ATPase
VDAFLDLAEAMAGRGPLALGLDDLQWADPSSLLTLGALARRLPDGPLALLVSCGRCPAAGTWSGPWRPWRPPGRAA